MSTQISIPRDAVVGPQGGDGVPSSGAAERLPLVVAGRCAGTAGPGGTTDDLAMAMAVAAALEASPSVAARHATGAAHSIECAGDELTAVLTSDGRTRVVLQAVAPRRTDLADRERTYVARYARLDPDARLFALPVNATGDQAGGPTADGSSWQQSYEFLRPGSWGFTPTPTGMHWTAHNLFRHSPASTPPKPCTSTRSRFKDVFDEAADPAPDRGDPFQCVPQLRQARIQCDAGRGDPATAAAYALALGLGRCRLFGVRLAEGEDFTLTPAAMRAASRQLEAELCKAVRRAEGAGDETARAAHLGHNVALELLEGRMDAHAAYLALDEAYAAAVYESDAAADVMSARMNRVRRMIERLDGNLKNQIPLLRTAARTYLIDNWRRLLAPAYRELPPWWLDGCLEGE